MPSQPAAFALAKCMAEDCQETVYVQPFLIRAIVCKGALKLQDGSEAFKATRPSRPVISCWWFNSMKH